MGLIIDQYLYSYIQNPIFFMQKSQKRFTFEHSWLLEEDFSDCFNQSWAESRDSVNLPDRLYKCSKDLKLWAGDCFHQLGRKIKTLQQELDRLMNSSGIRNNFSRIAEVERNIEKLTYQEEVF